MPPRIDPKSVGSLQLTLYAFSQRVGAGTGFVVRVDDIDILVTNYHVLSGRHPGTGESLGDGPALPDRLLVPLLRNSGPELRWQPVVQQLYNEYNRPLWVEHPRYGRRFDVVAMPLVVPRGSLIFPYTRDPGPDLALVPGSELAIIGFPEGMSAVGITAIWKSGSIASEPELVADEDQFFWIDANTRKGMSGAPVIARRFGGALMADGGYGLHSGVVDRIVGVYAGRALDAPDMTLGRVWKWEGVQEIIDETVARVRRGLLEVHQSHIGHYYGGHAAMVELDITRGAEVSVRNPAGVIETRTVTLGELLREFVLADDRFGVNLDRVRMAAAIDGAIKAAEDNGTALALEDNQYAVIREVVASPTKPYNAAVARFLLPLLDYVLAAGGGDAPA